MVNFVTMVYFTFDITALPPYEIGPRTWDISIRNLSNEMNRETALPPYEIGPRTWDISIRNLSNEI